MQKKGDKNKPSSMNDWVEVLRLGEDKGPFPL